MVRWGMIGARGIGRSVAAALAVSNAGRLDAVASRAGPADDLRDLYPQARIHIGYQALIDDPDIDAVYIATPHPDHARWARAAIGAGKHVLCEKPLCMDARQAAQLIDAARAAGVTLAEAYMYRFHPQTRRLAELVRVGTIGALRLIEADLGFQARYDPAGRLFDPVLGGGGILDVGGYPLSMARLIAGAAHGEPFRDPVTLAGAGHVGASGVDEWAAATLGFAGGIVAQVACGISQSLGNRVRLHGSEGMIEAASPWFAAGEAPGRSEIVVRRRGEDPVVEAIDADLPLYAYELEAMAQAIADGRQELSAMSWADTLGNMRALDAWRAQLAPTVPIGTRHLPAIGRVSRIGLGCMGLSDDAHFAEIADAFFDAGGNVFDTAWIYGDPDGETDRLLGRWLRSRGVRDRSVIVAKGGHDPFNTPDAVRTQLAETLDRLGTDRIDVHLLHRDNLDIPVGEFVDLLDAEQRAGRIGGYGFSNWTLDRTRAAIAYARANGRCPPVAVSQNFSLADMVQPVWDGCVAASTPDWRDWLEATNMPLFAWSAQARGFFTDRAGPDRLDDARLVRAWYSPGNFARKARAADLARRHGVSENAIALAYCLHQRLPLVPIVGPLTLAELRDSLRATAIALSAGELAWLEHGERDDHALA